MTLDIPPEHIVPKIERYLGWLPGPQSRLVRYGITTLLVILCFLLVKFVQELSGTDGFFILYVAVFLGALLFDRGSGFLASYLSTGLVIYSLWPEASSYLPERFWVPVVVFLLLGLGIAGLSEALRKGWERATTERHTKDVLYRELQHRTKNDFAMASSLLALQARSQPNPEIRQELLAAASRLTALSKAHERLEIGEAGPDAQMRDYLEALCQALRESSDHGAAVSLELDCAELQLPLGRAIPVGLITNELVTNAYRHAFPPGVQGAIVVRLRKVEDLELSVADNGEGWSKNTKPGIGSRLMEGLVSQLHGRMERESGDPGCLVRVTFPEQPQD